MALHRQVPPQEAKSQFHSETGGDAAGAIRDHNLKWKSPAFMPFPVKQFINQQAIHGVQRIVVFHQYLQFLNSLTFLP
jgi:hypothetical protein